MLYYFLIDIGKFGNKSTEGLRTACKKCGYGMLVYPHTFFLFISQYRHFE